MLHLYRIIHLVYTEIFPKINICHLLIRRAYQDIKNVNFSGKRRVRTKYIMLNAMKTMNVLTWSGLIKWFFRKRTTQHFLYIFRFFTFRSCYCWRFCVWGNQPKALPHPTPPPKTNKQTNKQTNEVISVYDSYSSIIKIVQQKNTICSL